MIPNIIYMFVYQLLNDKKVDIQNIASSKEEGDDRSLILSQQLLTSICNIQTPLSIGLAFDIYNETRSKTQITKMNRLHQCVRNDTFHRILTSVYNKVISIKEENGIYIPPNMTCGVFTHFAMDNIDWAEKTDDGSTYHSTSSIMIQPPKSTVGVHDSGVGQINTETISRKPAIDRVDEETIQVCRLTPGDRKKSRCLENIDSIESLTTCGPKVGELLLFLWGLTRMTPTQLLTLELDVDVPGFSAFCARVTDTHKPNEIGYLPLIPSSPTDPGVVKSAMMSLVKMARTIGMTHTIITCDQAVFEIAYALRKQHSKDFANVILMMGGFHLAHNFIKVIPKIMRGSGADEVLVAAWVFLPGTAKKSFGEKSDYYQSLSGLTILYEVMLAFRWEAIESWCIQQGNDTHCLELLERHLEDLSKCSDQTNLTRILGEAHPLLLEAENLV